MKKNLKKIFLLIFILPIIFYGCKKSDVTDDTKNMNSEIKASTVYCGTPMVTNIYKGDGTTSYGTVTVGNDAENLYITYALTGDWTINSVGDKWKIGVHAFVGSQAELLKTHEGIEFLTDETVHLWENNLPYKYEPSSPGLKEYTFTIPRTLITENCPYIIALVDIRNSVTNQVITDLSAKPLTKCVAFYFKYCLQYCKCETAYAKAPEPQSTCFLTLSGVNSNNWGWSNKVEAPGTYEWPIWAGAGQCNTSKATEVGKLKVVYDGKYVNVSYNLNNGFHLTETHLWIGKDYLNNKNGKYITAPGQFGNMHEGLLGASSDSYGPIEISAPFYIAAHSGVCW